MSSRKSGERQLSNFEACRQRGEVGRSFSHLSLALLLSPRLKKRYYPTYLEIFEKWSKTVEETQGLSQVMTLYEVALSHYPQSPDLHYLLAATLYRHGSIHEAWNHASLAQAGCSRDPCTQELQGRLANALVDRWHLPMLNDAGRNTAFKLAITRAVKEGYHTVLDIGSGTGLLSIYALKAGAQEVYACEEDKFMCEMSSSVLEMNSNATNIHILNKHSKDIVIPCDIPKKVSLVVTETVDAGLFGEHILSTLQHAWQHLLLLPQKSQDVKIVGGAAESQVFPDGKNVTAFTQASSTLLHDPCLGDYPDERKVNLVNLVAELKNVNFAEESNPVEHGRVIPSRAEVFLALISCTYIAKQTKYLNPDIECLKGKNVYVKLAEPYMSEKLSSIPGGFRLLSEWLCVTSVDFNSLEDITSHRTGEVNKMLTFRSIDSGQVDAVALAFNLYLDEENCIQTFPNPLIETVWENAVYPVVHPLSVASEETVTVDFQCRDVVRVSVRDETFANLSSLDSVELSTQALRFLNSKTFIDAYLSAAHQVFCKIQQSREGSKDTGCHSLVICDALPFPVAGLCLLSLLPDSRLYVEDEDTKNVLRRLGFTVGLCKELEKETLDALFLWPVTQEGTLIDGITEKLQMYRVLMAVDGLMFPQELELVMDVVSSPVLTASTRVSDANTCGVAVARIFNMIQTTHQLDVTLSSLPHTSSVLARAVPVLRISLVSGRAEALVKAQESPASQYAASGLLLLGGEVVEALTRLSVTRPATLTGISYWFILKGGFQHPHEGLSSAAMSSGSDAMLSTFSEDSPCNQSVFMLREALEVVAGEGVALTVVWREGLFSATVDRCQSPDTE